MSAGRPARWRRPATAALLGLICSTTGLGQSQAVAGASTSLPVVSALAPSMGPVGGGTAVTITGSGFTGATAVTFGAEPATSFTVVNGRTIHAQSPPAPVETVPVVVTTPTGSSAPSSSAQFSYLPSPLVTGLSPPAGAETGGNTVTITGSGLTDATEVAFGTATTTDFTVWSDTTITTFAPADAVGTTDVTVVTPGGTSPTIPSDHYTYFAGTNPGYHVSGNRVIAPDGSVFMPRGSIVPCLAYVPMNDAASHTNCGKNGNATNIANIEALGSNWHADDVRIQIAQENLFDQSPYDASYLSLVDSEVQLVNSLGMVATITLQEEVAPDGPVFPVASSVAFWNFMAQHFANNPMVMFDLFNEPHLSPFALSAAQTLWNIWRNGGFVDDESSRECTGPAQECVDTAFVGQQTLLTDVRDNGATNIVIAEGTHDDQDLTGIPQYALNGSNLVYGIEPNLYTTTTETDWAADYGDLSGTYPIFGESLVVFNASALCNATAPTLLPEEFQYMQSIGMGSLVWGMVPGDLTTSSPTVPTSYHEVSHVTCTSPEPGTLPGPPEPTNTVGPGADAIAFFAAEQSGVPLADPVITWVAPEQNGVVTITGSHLTATTDVTFDGVDAPSFMIVSATQVQAAVPASGEGTALDVLTSAGSTAVTLPAAPMIATVAAGNGSATVAFAAVPDATSYVATATDQTSPGNPVQTASGTASPLTVTGLTNGDDYSITVDAASGVGSGPASAPVTGVVPTSSLRLVQLSPDAFPLSSTTEVQLTGQGFTAGMSVDASGSGVTFLYVTVESPTTAEATVRVSASTAPGARTITITEPSGSATCAGCLTVDALPVIHSVSPPAVAAGATGTLKLKGQHFQPGVTVTLGSGISSTVVSSTGTGITVRVVLPSGAPEGAVLLTITNPDGGTVTCAACVSIIAPPSLTSMSVLTVSPGETTGVTLSGGGFTAGLKISGPTGVTFSHIDVLSATTVTATLAVGLNAPPVTNGAVTVTNSNAGGDGSVTNDLLNVR